MKRFGNGLSIQAEYQFTRSLDDVPISGGPQIWQYPARNYGKGTLARRQRLVFPYVYQLPLGRGRAFVRNAAAALDAVPGGWQFSAGFAQTGRGIVGGFGGRTDAVAAAPLYAGKLSASHDIVGGVQWSSSA